MDASPHPAAKKKDAWVKDYVGPLVHSIAAGAVEAAETKVSWEGGFERLCSYSWHDISNAQEIFVPGAPRKWTPLVLPHSLVPDGMSFADYNVYKNPQQPFEPMFRALAVEQPMLKLNDVDVIANRGIYMNLLNFVAGRTDRPGRMHLHLVDNTLIISRQFKTRYSEQYPSTNPPIYGHRFEEKFTTPIATQQKTASHYRVIRCHLGSLSIVVRHEVDAYVDDGNTDTRCMSYTAMGQSFNITLRTFPIPSGCTRVWMAGHHVDQSRIAEIKSTRGQRGLGQHIDQLWFGRTPWLLTGFHEDGKVHRLDEANVREQLKEWEERNQENLRKLVTLLSELRKAVQGSGESEAVLVREKRDGPLQIYFMLGQHYREVLPLPVRVKYWA